MSGDNVCWLDVRWRKTTSSREWVMRGIQLKRRTSGRSIATVASCDTRTCTLIVRILPLTSTAYERRVVHAHFCLLLLPTVLTARILARIKSYCSSYIVRAYWCLTYYSRMRCAIRWIAGLRESEVKKVLASVVQWYVDQAFLTRIGVAIAEKTKIKDFFCPYL